MLAAGSWQNAPCRTMRSRPRCPPSRENGFHGVQELRQAVAVALGVSDGRWSSMRKLPGSLKE